MKEPSVALPYPVLSARELLMASLSPYMLLSALALDMEMAAPLPRPPLVAEDNAVAAERPLPRRNKPLRFEPPFLTKLPVLAADLELALR